MTSDDFVQLDYIDVPAFVLEQDAQGVPLYRYINAKGLQISGYELNDFLGKSALQAYPDEGGRKALHHHQACFRTGKPVCYNISIGARDLRREYEMRLKPQIGPDGTVQRVYATGHDITDARDAEQTKNSPVHAQMEQFVTLAAHDLRTPMRNIRALTEMLRENFEDHGDGKVELIDMLEEVATKSSNLISQVLQHSLTAHAKPHVSVFALRDLCADIDAILDPQNAHDITWSDVLIETDRMVVQVVLRNLMDNAIKYGARSRLCINVSAWREDNQSVGIAVEDNGQGMTNPGIAFLDNGQMRADSGYGLLSIRRLLTARQGSISASPGANGKGTRVTFTLPGTLLSTHNSAAGQPETTCRDHLS